MRVSASFAMASGANVKNPRHLVIDNYAAHKHANVKAWPAGHPQFVVHLTPTHASCMNPVEVWFGIVERQAVRRWVFNSVKDQHQTPRLHRRLERPLTPLGLD